MFDLLAGALVDVPATVRVTRLPFSFQRPVVQVRRYRWRKTPLSRGAC
ncbi:MAG: hypothetical protein QOC94_4206 [Actinoplanes sp.]|jgi:hypothetical protein|nr:hypothetical protein [Actinoplanes sp.]